MEISYTSSAADALHNAIDSAVNLNSEFITPEHLLYVISKIKEVEQVFENYLVNYNIIRDSLFEYIKALPVKRSHSNNLPEMSVQFQEVMAKCALESNRIGNGVITVALMINSIFELKDSYANSIISNALGANKSSFISSVMKAFSDDEKKEHIGGISIKVIEKKMPISGEEKIFNQIDSSDFTEQTDMDPENQFVKNISSKYKEYNPLIGRTNELNRIVEAFCRCDNNNAIIVGDAGVGKTALVYGLARLIDEGGVPKRLKGSKVYEIDLAALVAGSQYRGEIEGRIRTTLDGLKSQGKAVVFIDGIQILMNISQNSDSGVDMMNVLKPYLEDNDVLFLGSASHDALSRYSRKNMDFLRRFQRIDVNEPSQAETKKIIEGLKEKYESFHKVTYTEEAIDYAIDMSVKHLKNRFLPEKAIDLLDQTGARSEVLGRRRKKIITKVEVADTLIHCFDIKAALEKSDEDALVSLEDRMLKKIYGQNEAIENVVNSVHLWKAGLTDSEKPIACLLFVGPTGVGKTEVARTLAEEMGLPLQRFDMSEYAEKHTVAKLIGSPAGYIGYEDGGLLTEAILKTPNCVLLLDELEKAHSDIYNILLQVMDYGSLTDNRGQKVNFQNVVIVMTSNAGAQYAHLAKMGFASRETNGSSMLTEVKKLFKPEFINRLSGTVVFNEMDRKMAGMILDKKLALFSEKLKAKGVNMSVDKKAHEWLLEKGITKEYGAREIDRVVSNALKPLFVKEILFGKLKNGGNVQVELSNDELSLNVKKEMEVVIATAVSSVVDVKEPKVTRKRRSAKSN